MFTLSSRFFWLPRSGNSLVRAEASVSAIVAGCHCSCAFQEKFNSQLTAVNSPPSANCYPGFALYEAFNN